MPDPETRSDTTLHRIIGRDRDLSAVFDQLKTRNSQFIGIKAASGIGKTRFLKEVVTRAGEIGQRILLIPCRGTAHRAFQPLAMLVREVLSLDQSMPPDQQHDKLTQLLKDMKRPDLLEPFSKLLNVRPGTSSPPPDSTFIDHHEGDDLEEVFSSSASVSLADAILVLVANLASERPVAILFDDLDQSGMASTTAIFKLLNGIQSSQGLSINIVGSFGPDAPEELQSQAGDLVNTLAPLSEDDISKLAAELAGGKSLDSEFAKKLGDIVMGSPLFLITIIDTLKAEGIFTVNGKG
jgi:predicted ATPase